MRITVKVTPRSSQKKIIEAGDILKVYVHESAQDGKANQAVMKMIAKHFSVPKSQVRIVRGEKNRSKIVDIQSM